MNNENDKSFKIINLHIEDYKMFKDFDIDFVDKDDNPLPIVVLAGVNGSGKTTLLEFIVEYFKHEENKLIYESKGLTFGLGETYSFGAFVDTYKSIEQYNSLKSLLSKNTRISNTIYISVEQNNIIELKESILEHYRRLSRKYSHLEALEEIQKFLNTIFADDMDITFKIDDIDIVLRDNEKVIFKNKSGDAFDIDKLSTGEKTLLSKVLYLYFKDYSNKVILIDEPELSLHPSWQNRVLKIYENFAKANNCQVIIATHSPHIIGSAKSESLRILKKVDEKIEAFKYSQSYGFEFDKILTDIMGVENLRTPEIAEDIKRLWELLKKEAYQSKEYQELYQKLEKLLGDLDQDLLLARLEVAKIKSRNA